MNRKMTYALALAGVAIAGCSDPCFDDGLLQDEGDMEKCLALMSASGTGSDSDTETITDSETESAEDGDDCNNGIQDGDETDVDCGGSCPNKCGDGEGCGGDDDCVSDNCNEDEGICEPGGDGTCDDEIQNQDESDVDCGGVCGPTCENGETCNGDGDCISDNCSDEGLCEPQPDGDCEDGLQNQDETDVDCGGVCGPTCEIGEMCDDEGDCVSDNCGDGGLCEENPLWCDDADGDGFGDPDDCTEVPPGEDPPDGSVNNDDDCDDDEEAAFPGAAPNDDATACMEDKDDDDWGDDDPSGPNTDAGTDCDDDSVAAADVFPGAAPNDDATACMEDKDDDDWGDDDPSDPGVDVGTDCDDDSAEGPFIFPGAAENESGSACMKDEDEDGWGDDDPPPGVTPGSDCDEDAAPPCALLITQDGTEDDSYDQGLVSVLDNNLGYVITNLADTGANLSDADGFTVVVISETAQSTDVADTFEDVLVPVVCLEGFIWDDMSLAPMADTSTETELDILDAVHPLAAGFNGTHDVIAGGGSGLFYTTPPAGALEIASVTGQASQITYFAFDQGDTMLGGFVAPRRRVGLGYDADQNAGAVTILDDGLTLFEAAITWVTG